MASLIKNQIIKRLSKFVKNLSSKQINLSTFKGEGVLNSIDLDEQALTELIALPTWLNIKSAHCGRIVIKIPWTNLKTLPIQLQLEKVSISIETCDELRDIQNQVDASSATDPLLGKYGFTHRVIDGVSLSITNLTLSLEARGFQISIVFPSLDIHSTSPTGERVDNLKHTRIRSKNKDHILLFKEISWPNARIEASSKEEHLSSAAIRIIINACRIRISMKKYLEDSTMMASRLTLVLEDLLLVINDAQLSSALNTYREIAQLVKRASEQRKQTASDKLTKSEKQRSSFQPKAPTTGVNEKFHSNNSLISQKNSKDAFEFYDVVETSLHLKIKRLDLHVIADSDGLSNRLVEDGALHMTLANICVDHYPYHEFGSSKTHWIKYTDMQSLNRDEWTDRIKRQWNAELHQAKSRAPQDENSIKLDKALMQNQIRLFESCTVINIDDFVFYPVTMNDEVTQTKVKNKKKTLMKSDRSQYQLPEHLGIVSIQFSDYYYPAPFSLPVPNSILDVQIMPIAVFLDLTTLGWLHAFMISISKTIDKSGVFQKDTATVNYEHVTVKFEAMLLRMIASSDIFSGANAFNEFKEQEDVSSNTVSRDETMELIVSKFLMTNDKTDWSNYAKKAEHHLTLLKNEDFFKMTEFPFSMPETSSKRISDRFDCPIHQKYLYRNPLNESNSRLEEAPSAKTATQSYFTMTTDSLKRSLKFDVWHFSVENVYLDFFASSNRSAKQNMVDALSINCYTALDEMEVDEDMAPWLNVLCVIENSFMLKVSSRELNFAMKLIEPAMNFLSLIEKQRALREKVTTNFGKDLADKNQIDPFDKKKITVDFMCPNTFMFTVVDDLPESNSMLQSSIPKYSSNQSIDQINVVGSSRSSFFEVPTFQLFTETKTPSSETSSLASVPSGYEVTFNNPSSNTPPTVQRKKSKFEERIQRGLEKLTNASRTHSQSLVLVSNDDSDDFIQLDQPNEDLDADSEAFIPTNDLDQQEKPARISLDDDNSGLIEKKSTPIVLNPEAKVNGCLVKLNRIKMCFTNIHVPHGEDKFVIGLSLQTLRIDDIHSMKFDSIKPKIFESEHSDEVSVETVQPIFMRIESDKLHQINLAVTLRITDQICPVSLNAVDMIKKMFDKIDHPRNRSASTVQKKPLISIEIFLNNFRFLLKNNRNDLLSKIRVDRIKVTRRSDDEIFIEKLDESNAREKIQFSQMIENDVEETVKLNELDKLRKENEKLHHELKSSKIQMRELRVEIDALRKTVNKIEDEASNADLNHQNLY